MAVLSGDKDENVYLLHPRGSGVFNKGTQNIIQLQHFINNDGKLQETNREGHTYLYAALFPTGMG